MKVLKMRPISSKLYLSSVFLISINLFKVFGLGISDLFLISATAFALFESVLRPSGENIAWIKNPMVLPFAVFTIGALLSLGSSNNLQIAILEIFQSVYVGIFFFPLTWIMVKRGLLNKIVMNLILSSLIANLIALYDKFANAHFGSILGGAYAAGITLRFAGPFGHPNTLGTFSLITFSLAFVLLMCEKSTQKKLFYISAILFSLSGVALSGSNMALFGLISSVIIIIIFMTNKWQINLFLKILWLLLLIIPLLSFTNIGKDLIQPISRNVNRAMTVTINARTEIYSSSLSAISDSPLIGKGFDQLPTSGISESERLLPGFIHNVILSTWYSGGVLSMLGLFITMVFLVVIALRSLFLSKSPSYPPLLLALASSSLAILIISQTEASLYRRDWWLIFGLLWAVYIESSRKGDRYGNRQVDALSESSPKSFVG